MLRKMFSYGGVLLLAGAAMLMTPTSGWAAGHGGGGHGGGGHGGGGHGGGHFGGGHLGSAHFSGARFGGYRGGVYGGGYRYGAWRGYNHPRYGYGFGGYYPMVYGLDYDYPYAYDTYPYAWSGIDNGYGYTGLYGGDTLSDPSLYAFTNPPATSYQAYYPPTSPTTFPDARAHLNVTVPADAQVWFDDTLMKTPGPNREFESPALTPGAPYTYNVRARWTQNGKEVTQTQKVDVSAGAHVNVTFPVPTQPAAQPSAQK